MLSHTQCRSIWHNPPPGWRHPDLYVVWLTDNDPEALKRYLDAKYVVPLMGATA